MLTESNPSVGHKGAKDITGFVFGKLTAIRRNGSDKQAQALWECKCECGIVKNIPCYRLLNGGAKSCGLCNRFKSPLNAVPGYTKDPLYKIWANMKRRCESPGNRDYPRYGGRGIKLCERWQAFENFKADMGARPDGCSLERNDNDNDYEPSNCRWATIEEQNNNKRGQRRFLVDGQWLGIRQSSRYWGVTYEAAKKRLADFPSKVIGAAPAPGNTEKPGLVAGRQP